LLKCIVKDYLHDPSFGLVFIRAFGLVKKS
jgi:hypothetical protein